MRNKVRAQSSVSLERHGLSFLHMWNKETDLNFWTFLGLYLLTGIKQADYNATSTSAKLFWPRKSWIFDGICYWNEFCRAVWDIFRSQIWTPRERVSNQYWQNHASGWRHIWSIYVRWNCYQMLNAEELFQSLKHTNDCYLQRYCFTFDWRETVTTRNGKCLRVWLTKQCSM